MQNKKNLIFIFLCTLICIILTCIFISCQIFNDFSLSSGNDENENLISEKDVNKEEELKKDSEETKKAAGEISVKLWVDDNLPYYLGAVVKKEAKKSFNSIVQVDSKIDADIVVETSFVDKSSGIFWVLVPVTSFFRYCDGISWMDLEKFWIGDKDSLSYITNQKEEATLIVSRDIFSVLEKVLGKCGNDNVKIVEGKEDVETSVESNEDSFSIIPFDEIKPEFKVLDVDKMSVFDKDLNILDYPLTLSVDVKGQDNKLTGKLKSNLKQALISNRDINDLAIVNMTGVTALVRGTANRMNKYGVLYPAEKIVDILKDADITHISNEIPFVEGCSGARDKDLVFCSKPEYMELLRYVGTDVVELTGNHMNDYGHKWMLYTLDMYEKEGWPYFGGGRNLEYSYQPATFEINGNKIAFLGCNQFGPAYDWATEDDPGSAPPNYEKFEEIIKQLKQEGYIVIFTFQYAETYNYHPIEQQIIDFRRMIDAGADIVSGSQSHHPMGVEFRGDGFINYGLGNLFFDQMYNLGVRQGIIAKHIFCDGKHINTVLITTMLEDYCQPRPTTAQERLELLKSVFEGSIK